MGQIKLISDTMPNLLPMLGRSSGIHVSEVIHDYCVRLAHYTPRAADEGFNQAQLELGNAFERAHIDRLIESAPDRYWRPGELEKDRIFGTPDLLDLEEECIDEFKCTWVSLRNAHDHDGSKLWKYWVQIKAYASMMGWRRGRLRVLFVNGAYDYGPGGGPRYRCWQQEFTKVELANNWEMIRKRAREMERERGL